MARDDCAVRSAWASGTWGVRAPSGWHLSSFTDTIDVLPAFIERRLRECVHLSMTDAQAVGS